MSKIKCFFLEDTGKTTKEDGFGPGIYRRADTNEEMTLIDAPAGAMWFGVWYGGRGDYRLCKPQLQYPLIVKLPNGHDWIIDSQSSNCGIPDDRKQERHHCWIIEGTAPPDISVSKNGITCRAGGGSIQAGNYHGFLRNGYLEEC